MKQQFWESLHIWVKRVQSCLLRSRKLKFSRSLVIFNQVALTMKGNFSWFLLSHFSFSLSPSTYLTFLFHSFVFNSISFFHTPTSFYLSCLLTNLSTKHQPPPLLLSVSVKWSFAKIHTQVIIVAVTQITSHTYPPSPIVSSPLPSTASAFLSAYLFLSLSHTLTVCLCKEFKEANCNSGIDVKNMNRPRHPLRNSKTAFVGERCL